MIEKGYRTKCTCVREDEGFLFMKKMSKNKCVTFICISYCY